MRDPGNEVAFKRDKSTSHNFVARSAALRPNIFYPEIHEVDLWQVYPVQV